MYNKETETNKYCLTNASKEFLCGVFSVSLQAAMQWALQAMDFPLGIHQSDINIFFQQLSDILKIPDRLPVTTCLMHKDRPVESTAICALLFSLRTTQESHRL